MAASSANYSAPQGSCDVPADPSRCPLESKSNALDEIEKPIRVIDIRRTLSCKRGIHFKKSLDWNFHVLSHTWSASVRALSQWIGQRIGAASDRDRDAYSRAFEEVDLSQDLCYKQLLEFFELLMGDGVERIWFDALCINQSEEDEKSHEIRNMGPYYSLSNGCYVLTHGVGEGYGLWGKNRSGRGSELPRWFTRVWTFQEFLLPRRLCFIVEGVDERFVAVVNQLIRGNSRIGFCRCFLEMTDLNQILLSSLGSDDLKWMGGFELRDQNWKSFIELMDERAESDKWRVGPARHREPDSCYNWSHNTETDKSYRRDLVKEKLQMQYDSQISATLSQPWAIPHCEQRKIIISSDEICIQCGSKPMIRKANTASQSPRYLVDREAYLAVMQCDSRMVEGPAELKPTKGIQALRGLYCALGKGGSWRPCHVICEVGWRDCSVEEDRVLSILGLLGLKLDNLRTQKTLKDQVMELTKAGGSEMLIELCMTNQKGGKMVGLSWAPDFHGENQTLDYVLRPAQVDMDVKRLREDGPLELRAKVVCGKVVPIDDQGTGEASHCLIVPQTSHDQDLASTAAEATRIPLDLQTRIPSSQQFILHFDFNSVAHPAFLGSFEVPIDSNAQLVSFPVRLVLLGKDDGGNKLILLCIVKESSKPEELHKIGLIALQDMAMELHRTFESCKMQDCVIGGFGEDMSDYIHVHQ